MKNNFLVLVFTVFLTSFVHAQNIQNASTYQSDLDSSLTIKKITLLPVTDNVNSIYARPIEESLKNSLNGNHQYSYVDPNFAGALLTPEELEDNPEQVKKISEGIDTDVILCARATKTTAGVTLHLSLFFKKDGTLLAQQVLKDQSSFETSQLQSKSNQLLEKILKQIPYDGLVLSRTDNKVTLNLGKKNGLKNNQIVTAILLLNLNRHPKFNFIISSEKEVLGKIKLTKVEDTLSFGQIISEKGRGTIKKDTKISGIDFVNYDDAAPQPSDLAPEDKGNLAVFGKDPQEWKPSAPPTFGKVGVFLGLGQYTYKTKLRSAGSLEPGPALFPSIRVLGELWMTPRWILNYELMQGIAHVENPLSGSSPTDLSVSTSSHTLTVGYKIPLQQDFFGPSLQVALGYSSYSVFVDQSTPLSLSSTKYSGLLLGLRGNVPVSDDKKWNFGATLDLFISDTLKETPSSSGSSYDNTINRFGVFGWYQTNTRMRIRAGLDFSSYSTTFTGDGSRTDDADSSSQTASVLNGGLEYLF